MSPPGEAQSEAQAKVTDFLTGRPDWAVHSLVGALIGLVPIDVIRAVEHIERADRPVTETAVK